MLNQLIKNRMEKMREVRALEREMWELIKKHRKELPPKRYFVLKARYHERKTLGEVGKELQVSVERVRQIEQVSIIQLDAFLEQNK